MKIAIIRTKHSTARAAPGYPVFPPKAFSACQRAIVNHRQINLP
jgi:hypothetical protein